MDNGCHLVKSRLAVTTELGVTGADSGASPDPRASVDISTHDTWAEFDLLLANLAFRSPRVVDSAGTDWTEPRPFRSGLKERDVAG